MSRKQTLSWLSALVLRLVNHCIIDLGLLKYRKYTQTKFSLTFQKNHICIIYIFFYHKIIFCSQIPRTFYSSTSFTPLSSLAREEKEDLRGTWRTCRTHGSTSSSPKAAWEIFYRNHLSIIYINVNFYLEIFFYI